MQGMNGWQLAEAARQLRPGLKVLFVTGYSGTAVLEKNTFGERDRPTFRDGAHT